MRRKLIKQGASGLTICLPKKWTDKHGLNSKDEVDVVENEDTLIISSTEQVAPEKSIVLSLKDTTKSALRIAIINAYRIGYDKIIVDAQEHEEEMEHIVKNLFIGFEIFETDKKFSIESVTEPSYEDFDRILQKLFFIILDIFDDLNSSKLEDKVFNVERYDNFLKRCISKRLMNFKSKTFMWQFLSGLSRLAREALHLKQYSKTLKLSDKEAETMGKVIDIIKIIQKGYLKKDIQLLLQIHKIDWEIGKIRHELLLKAKDPLVAHYILYFEKLAYLASSPLIGALQTEDQTNQDTKNN